MTSMKVLATILAAPLLMSAPLAPLLMSAPLHGAWLDTVAQDLPRCSDSRVPELIKQAAIERAAIENPDPTGMARRMAEAMVTIELHKIREEGATATQRWCAAEVTRRAMGMQTTVTMHYTVGLSEDGEIYVEILQ